MKHTPESIRQLITDRGETVSTFAQKVGVSRIAVHNWLNGRKTPRKRHARRLSALQGGLKRRRWTLRHTQEYAIRPTETKE